MAGLIGVLLGWTGVAHSVPTMTLTGPRLAWTWDSPPLDVTVLEHEIEWVLIEPTLGPAAFQDGLTDPFAFRTPVRVGLPCPSTGSCLSQTYTLPEYFEGGKLYVRVRAV